MRKSLRVTDLEERLEEGKSSSYNIFHLNFGAGLSLKNKNTLLDNLSFPDLASFFKKCIGLSLMLFAFSYFWEVWIFWEQAYLSISLSFQSKAGNESTNSQLLFVYFPTHDRGSTGPQRRRWRTFGRKVLRCNPSCETNKRTLQIVAPVKQSNRRVRWRSVGNPKRPSLEFEICVTFSSVTFEEKFVDFWISLFSLSHFASFQFADHGINVNLHGGWVWKTLSLGAK